MASELVTCPRCKSWGDLPEGLRCPDCGLEFTEAVLREMRWKSLVEEVVHRLTRGLDGLWQVIQCFIEENDPLYFSEDDIAFNEAFIELCRRELNTFDAGDMEPVRE